MGYAGNPESWADLFPDGLVPEIIDLVVTSWSGFTKPQPTDLEVPITKRFCVWLRGAKLDRQLPFNIWAESEELDQESGELIGRIDLRLVHGHREEVYFAFECKRLNVVRGDKRSSLAAEYVQEGMMRYVRGQYAGALDKGGMLGYVMDGKVSEAIDFVREAIDSRRELLRLGVGGSLSPYRVCPKQKQVGETNHKLDRGGFLIYHLFLGV
jgi:hypothetical protein